LDSWYLTRILTGNGLHHQRDEFEFNKGCSHAGLFCNQSTAYSCFCKPCVKADEVDVYQHNEGEEDPHLLEFYGEVYPGCSKMSICAEIRQKETATLRVFDNRARDNAEVVVEVHAGDDVKTLPVKHIPGTYAYEFEVMDEEAQVQVIDIRINGVAIPTSPVRVVVLPADCGPRRDPNEVGECGMFTVPSIARWHHDLSLVFHCEECAGNTFKVGSDCITSPLFFSIILGVVSVIVGLAIILYLGHKRKQNDLVWHIQADELQFNDPPDIIGQGKKDIKGDKG
jgi:hypothetical protein